MKFEIFKFDSVTSTNDVAINLIKEEKKVNGFVYAGIQTKGRGSHGKKWISNKGNFFGTIFFSLKNNYPPFNEFSIINAVIISNVIENYCKNKNISFKWPNDVFVNGKKICGILQELVTLESNKYLIVGIGVNVVSHPNIIAKHKATNILIETKKKPQIKKIIKMIINSYEKFFYNLNLYDYKKFKARVESMASN